MSSSIATAVRLVGIAALVVPSWSCSGGVLGARPAFDLSWQNDQGASIAELQKHLGSDGFPLGAPVAVGVVPDGLVGVSLRSGKTWSYRHAVDSRPRIAGSVVAVAGGGEVALISAGDGHRL